MDTPHRHPRSRSSDPPRGDDREAQFRSLFTQTYDDVLKFARRRVHPSHAEDVVADAFLVAWRRFDEAPRLLPDQRAWLYGIARNCLLNSRRGQERQEALAVRLRNGTSPADCRAPGLDGGPGGAASADDAGLAATRIDIARAWQSLPAQEQEVISLSAFEGLTSPEAALVLGTTSAAYRLRLMRARRRLRAALSAPPRVTTTPLEASHEHA